MKRLKQLRDQRHLNQAGLAIKINVSQSTISAYEVGEREPGLGTLIDLAKFFNVSIDYLAGFSDIKQNITTSDLSPDEIEHLHTYRKLSVIDKEKLKSYIDGLESK